MVPDDAARALLERAEEIVGNEHVVLELDRYLDDYALGDRHRHAPVGAVRPGSVDQVQAIMRLANELGVHVWPIGQGRNLGYGGPAPRRSGGVTIDLSRMDAVLEVDDTTASAIIEPGVRFFDLHAALVERGSRLMCSVPDLGWGSVVGNALERGYGYTAHGDHQQFVCGLEVVLPTGELVRTGMGALPGSDAWPLYRGGFGPGLDSLFMQSNLGIVTKMGIWLQPRPQEIAACRIAVEDEATLPALVDMIRERKLDGTIDGVVNAANAVGVAAGMAPRERWYDGDGVVPDDVVDTIAAELGLGRWNVKCSLYGTTAMLDLKLETLQASVDALGGARLVVHRYPGDAAPDDVEPQDHFAAGIPGMLLADGVRWRANGPTGAHIGLCPVSAVTGERVALASRIMREHIEAAGFDYIGGWLATERHAVNVLMIFFDAADVAEAELVRRTFAELVPVLASHGFGEYRAHLEFMDLVQEQFDFNDGALASLLQDIKGALDPAGVLAPGKQGVWPR